ncbi:hypothetical protein TPHA_0C00850 [Tetrapisispora phaffii CBS 4417]|uniref:RING-type domain-containing protein n=1 Tax=Tetrapisispora phaffii (strain ATCC 24235 / CBS 4417 / NBRC 1672 / NRRL Y-8282 / UCD 70-5) TaxID=1071381 RepID=G8BR65_TETPH|nr:hypothetical protein TPHA_0C00850 [Tetrapisispora phaffii CBS 4417]CCE62241.1 hypothetical protein TPHA_0C00850 [Tetrapisispora phaffii CBS 4417]
MSNENRDNRSGPADSNEPDGNSANRDTLPPTRNITVSIQYSYLFPNGSRLNQSNMVNTNNMVQNNVTSTTATGTRHTATENETTTTSTDTPHLNDASFNPFAMGVNLRQRSPDGAVILSFRDVPASTSQERLDNIISIAAEFAIRRFSDLQVPTRAITKEQFETLPVLKLSDIVNENDKTCSICYDDLVDEDQVEEGADNKRKYSVDEEDDIKDQKKVKTGPNNNRERPTEQLLDAVRSSTSAQNNTESETQTSRPASGVDTIQSEEDSPTYLHSPTELPCKHIFGRECLYKWTRVQNTCPLCRHIIAESPVNAPPNAPDGNNGGTVDAFERIRQLIYNTNPNDSVNPASSNRDTMSANDEQSNTTNNDNTNNSNDNNTNENLGNISAPPTAANTSTNTPGNSWFPAASGAAPFPFGNLNSFDTSVSRPGVVYLNGNNNPSSLPGFLPFDFLNRQRSTAEASLNRTNATSSSNENPISSSNEAPATSSAENPNTTSTNSSAPGSSTDNNTQRISWVPIPITFIQLENTGNTPLGTTPLASQTPAGGANNPTLDPNSTPSSSQQPVNGDNTNPELTQSDRLRNILDHIFNVTASGRPIAPSLNGTQPFFSSTISGSPGLATSTAASTSTARPTVPASTEANTNPPTSGITNNNQSRAQQAQSFLTDFLRFAVLPRRRTNPNEPQTGTNEGSANSQTNNRPVSAETQPFFNTGVASYRNRDGEVSTYNISGSELPNPPSRNGTENSAENASSSHGTSSNENASTSDNPNREPNEEPNSTENDN